MIRAIPKNCQNAQASPVFLGLYKLAGQLGRRCLILWLNRKPTQIMFATIFCPSAVF